MTPLSHLTPVDPPPSPPLDARARESARRRALGAVVRSFRRARGWSVRDAAADAGVAPMTWRRVEQGLEVRACTLARLDRALSRPAGDVASALEDDVAATGLAAVAGLRPALGEAPPAFVDRLAARLERGTGPPSAAAELAGLSDLALAVGLLERLAELPQVPAVRAAAAAVGQVLPTLAARMPPHG